MARLTFVALAAAMALAMVSLPTSPLAAATNDVAFASPEQLAARDAAFDPLNDPDIEIIDDVEDTDFDDLPGFDDDDDDDDVVAEAVTGLTNVTRRTHPHRKHRHAKHPAHKHKKHSHRHSRTKLHVSAAPDVGAKLLGKDYKVTWYSAHDLLNPACGAGKWQPSKRSHVGAVGSSSPLKCGDFIQLCSKKGCVKVRIVDACAGCSQRTHVDLSKAAFLQLATGGLDQGEVHGVHSFDLGNKISPWAINLFGGKLASQGQHPY
ncbi:hypothetical protein OC842_006286 [Tilletia horrida]|uniref:RlpA-like protein double-psi beta-barrel domain-containing protein n=1 Tax=Tilletia horrida TaxID=155126 RepID=A0AAN6G672_9BASI|nr:hypothetical protein OC842_006286 [Tilletia horrida]